MAEPTVKVFNYSETSSTENEITSYECVNYKSLPGITWIDIKDVGTQESIEKICECYQLHQLVRESLIEHDKRPKIEDHGDYLFIVIDTLVFSEEKEVLVIEPVYIVIGANYVITVRDSGIADTILDPVKKRIRGEGSRLRKSGADYLAYRIIDALVDYYFKLLEKYGESVEMVEWEIFNHDEKDFLLHIQKLRKDLLFMRESIWPLREVLNSLQRGESRLINPETRVYMRDVYDHTVQIMETLETNRDVISSMLEIYFSTINSKLNETMKVLTIISTIFIPLTFISSIYGMNFHYMPELNWKYGYLTVWGLMVGVVVIMLSYFKRKRWF
ncbi:MAG: magnesium/cobalt transporter CorA [Candidatus Saganbacteria bacterium]|nr:magnesium/cobalt transporter CorA [Candidatus Saganbacteria bacterium]